MTDELETLGKIEHAIGWARHNWSAIVLCLSLLGTCFYTYQKYIGQMDKYIGQIDANTKAIGEIKDRNLKADKEYDEIRAEMAKQREANSNEHTKIMTNLDWLSNNARQGS
jgi:hypothetical protein